MRERECLRPQKIIKLRTILLLPYNWEHFAMANWTTQSVKKKTKPKITAKERKERNVRVHYVILSNTYGWSGCNRKDRIGSATRVSREGPCEWEARDLYHNLQVIAGSSKAYWVGYRVTDGQPKWSREWVFYPNIITKYLNMFYQSCLLSNPKSIKPEPTNA